MSFFLFLWRFWFDELILEVTPLTLQRKRHRLALKKARYEAQKNAAQEYAALISSRVKEEKARKSEIKKRRQSSRRISQAPGS